MSAEDITAFTFVDRSQDPGFYRQFLDAGNALRDIRAAKTLILDGLRLAPGQRVLDAGCGMGDDVFAIAARVGATGCAVGCDLSAIMVDEARRRAPAGQPIELHVADVQELQFADASFDGVRAERLLRHVPDTRRAVGELVRVLRPGGRIALFDFDWDTFVIDSGDKETTRLVTRSFSDHMKNGWIGRQLPGLRRGHGLTDVTARPHPVFVHFDFLGLLLGGHLRRLDEQGVLPAAERARWWAGLAAADARGAFLAGFLAIIASGTRT